MKSISSLFQTERQESKINSERADIIRQFVEKINLGRPCTYKDKNGQLKKANKVTPKQIAVRVGHLKDNNTLYYLLSVCKSSDNFSKRFYWETRMYKPEQYPKRKVPKIWKIPENF